MAAGKTPSGGAPGTRGQQTRSVAAVSAHDEPSGVHVEHLIEESAHASRGFVTVSRFVTAWLWLLLTVTAVAAFVLGYLGSDSAGWWRRTEDALHLFPSSFPSAGDSGPSWERQVATHLAPIVAYTLTLLLLYEVYKRQLRRLKARLLRRNHVVVCGLGEKGTAAAHAFLDAGRTVTCVGLDPTGDEAEGLSTRGALLLPGDATQEVTLRDARVDRATDIVCACGTDSMNATVAAQATRLARRRDGRPARIFAHISNPELAHVLRASALHLSDVRLHFFNIQAIWARELVRAGPLGEKRPLPTAPRLVVAGTTELATALVVGAARRWHILSRTADSGRMKIVVVDRDAEEACTAIEHRYPALRHTTELVPVSRAVTSSQPGDFASLLADAGDAPAAVYICLPDDGDTFGVALQVRHQLGYDGPTILVPASSWTIGLKTLLVPPGSRIVAVGYSSRSHSLDLLRDGGPEAIARAVHAEYLRHRELRDHDALDRRKAPAAAKPWDDLDERFRESSRRHVDHMLEQLGWLWYEVEPMFDWDEPPLELADEQVEFLARVEHDRWLRDLVDAGWTEGDRNDARKAHPSLVAWERLPDEVADIDRELVSSRPTVLARAGYRLVRSGDRERLARALHARYVADRHRVGESEQDNPSVVPWERLPDEQRELSRAAVDDIPIKLSTAGYRPARSYEDVAAASLTDDELDRLAEAAHVHWRGIRRAQGWTYGAMRDHRARVHPSLVLWDELPEEVRQIDRDQVGAIPALLAEVGLSITRLDPVRRTG